MSNQSMPPVLNLIEHGHCGNATGFQLPIKRRTIGQIIFSIHVGYTSHKSLQICIYLPSLELELTLEFSLALELSLALEVSLHGAGD